MEPNIVSLQDATPPAPAGRPGMARSVLACFEDAGLVNISGWQADGDELLVPFEDGGSTLIGTIRLDQHATNLATIDEDSPLYQALYAIGRYDVEFLQDPCVIWQGASDTPGVIYVQDRNTTAFLRKLLDLIQFCRSVLAYGAGLNVTAAMDEQTRRMAATILDQAEAIERLQAVANALSVRRAS